MRDVAAAALVAVLLSGLLAVAPTRAEGLKLEPGKPLDIVCETRAVSVAEEAQATTGSVRLRLEPAAAPASGEGDKAGEGEKAASPGRFGRWSIADVPAAHVASFALRQREACAAASCPFEAGDAEHRLHLWAPQKIMPDKVAPDASMSLAALDLAAMTLRVSSFREGAIAALEQGDCKPAP